LANGVATKVNDSGNAVGVQLHPYDYTCTTILTEEVIKNHRLTAVCTHMTPLRPDSQGWVESNCPRGAYYSLEPILVVVGVKEKKATAFRKVGIVTVGDLGMLTKDLEKIIRVMSLAKGIGMKTLNKLLEDTHITLPGKPPSVKNHLHAENHWKNK
jgi:hypothetical protein